jgi:serine/threonine-protein kinase RsbW
MIIRLDLPATYPSLNILGACIVELLANIETTIDHDMVVYSVRLAAHETCTNIIDHAYHGHTDGRITATLVLEPKPARITIEVTDTGRSFNITDVPEPNLDEPREHGYGLFLIRRLMDEVVYQALPNENNWRLIKYL